MAPGLGVIDRDDIGSLAGGILDLIQQNVDRTRIRSQSLCNNDNDNGNGNQNGDGDDSIPITVNRSASFDKTDKRLVQNTPAYDTLDTIVQNDDDQPPRTQPLHLVGSKSTLRKYLLDPNTRSIGSTTPNSISRTSSRDLLEEMSDAGSLVQAIMDDIGKVKTDVEAAQELLANSRSYEELIETLSIQDINPFEEDSIGSNFTFEGGQSVTSRLSFHSYTKRIAIKREGSLVLLKKKGKNDTHGLPKPTARPPFILQCPKPPKKKTMNQEAARDTDVDVDVGDEIDITADEQTRLKQSLQEKITIESNNNSLLDLFLSPLSHPCTEVDIEIETSTDVTPRSITSQSHDPNTFRIESTRTQTTHNMPPNSLKVQSLDSETSETLKTHKTVLQTSMLKHTPQQGAESKETRGLPERVEVVQRKPPFDLELLPRRSSPLHSAVVKRQQTPSEHFQSQSVPARQKKGNSHSPNSTLHSSPQSPNAQHHFTQSKQVLDRKELRQKQTQQPTSDQSTRNKTVTPPSQTLPDDITYQRSIRSTKTGDSSVRRPNDKSHRHREEGLHSSPRSSTRSKHVAVVTTAPPMQMEGAIGERARREKLLRPRQIRSEPETRHTGSKNVSEERKRHEEKRRPDDKALDESRRMNEKTRHKLKAQDETRRSDDKIRHGVRLSDKFNVREMRLPHEIHHEKTGSQQDEYLYRARKEHVVSRHAYGKQGHNHQGGVGHSNSMVEHEISMKHRLDPTSKSTREARTPLSGTTEALNYAKHKDGTPMIITFDMAKSGRSVSPYEEKDDREIDLNELTAKLPDFGHFTIRDKKVSSRAGPWLR